MVWLCLILTEAFCFCCWTLFLPTVAIHFFIIIVTNSWLFLGLRWSWATFHKCLLLRKWAGKFPAICDFQCGSEQLLDQLIGSHFSHQFSSVAFSSAQFSSVAQSCPTLCDPMNRSMPGRPVHHQLPEPTQTHVHRVSDAIQPSHHPLSSLSPPAPNPSQHQGLFQWINSSHEAANPVHRWTYFQDRNREYSFSM